MWHILLHTPCALIMSKMSFVSAGRLLSSVTHRLHTLKLLPLLDLLQFAHIVQWLLLKVLPHGFHLDVCLWERRTHIVLITGTNRCMEAKKTNGLCETLNFVLVLLMEFYSYVGDSEVSWCTTNYWHISKCSTLCCTTNSKSLRYF